MDARAHSSTLAECAPRFMTRGTDAVLTAWCGNASALGAQSGLRCSDTLPSHFSGCMGLLKHLQMKKRSEKRHKHCQKFSHRSRPLLGGAGRPKFKLESSLPLYLQTQFGEDRCAQFRVIVVTDPQTNTHIHTQTRPITIHCAAASAQCE